MNLDNVIDESMGIDGAFEVNLSFKYYEPTNAFAAPPVADLILPISKSGAQMFSENPAVTSITIPENTASAFVEIYASGAAKEEFWYTNALDEAIPILASHSNTSVTGKGPYREVQLLIDNKLVGVVLPFPVIFTGGIVLSWWSPMAAYGAFDLPTYLLDVTPFIPTLTDGKAHNFTLAVEGLGVNRSINGNFFLSGNLALVTDRAGGRTTGKITKYENTPRLKTSAGLCKDGLRTVIEAGRVISISSDVITGSGTKKVDFSQTMVYKSTQIWNSEGKGQQIKQISSGSIVSTTNGNRTFSEKFNYPLGLTLKSEKDSLVGKLKLRYNRVLQSTSFVGLGNNIDTSQIAKGSLKLESPGRASSGFGETEQIFRYSDARGSTYFRDVAVSNVTKFLRDETSGSLADMATDGQEPPLANQLNSLTQSTSSEDQLYGHPARIPSSIVVFSQK
ncbi:hypothetical protein CROQUDRAFT_709231 [Cronartium quercuum f. sp. fusiforme G11]|uniref:Peptide N-acetyl-beta-D-glucosaminyl asparaginase amidase A N-terminal domain-containing protein n=1 Tax=Cronartium quercuum f. sp. fusiforme G11 TaxID=708437 RepID=A0A9P6TA87_9BASI|nr:hypothetical protein CROQUDRAFT_709231 [Cronartium quercuum f. sp. fusiforme G11]